MHSRSFACVSAFVLVLSHGVALGQAADSDTDLGFFTGVRLWANQWQIGSVDLVPVLLPNGVPGVQQVPRTTVSDIKLAPILTIGARFSRFIAAASFFPSTNYDAKEALEGDVSRSEYDISLGYSLLPNLVASVAYKEAKQSKIMDLPVSSEQKVRAGLLGLSAAAPLSGKLSLYGNVAWGIGRQTSDIVDATGDTSYSVNYRIGEVGLSYRLMDGGPDSAIKATVISLGYRAQVLISKDIAYAVYELTGSPGSPVPTTTPLAMRKADLQTTTDGMILSIIATF